MFDPVGKATLKEELTTTEYFWGERSEIAGKTLKVLEKNRWGDCFCLCEKGLVDVAAADVEKFEPIVTRPGILGAIEAMVGMPINEMIDQVERMQGLMERSGDSDEQDEFDFGGDAFARKEDPSESAVAALEMRGERANAMQRRVLATLLDVHPEGLSSHGLVDRSGIKWSSLTPRIKPLRKMGFIESHVDDDGNPVLDRSTGRPCRVWFLTELGKKYIEAIGDPDRGGEAVDIVLPGPAQDSAPLPPARPPETHIKMAISNLGGMVVPKNLRWSHVGRLFGLGSTSAIALCKEHGFDPHERIGKDQCEDCTLVEED